MMRYLFCAVMVGFLTASMITTASACEWRSEIRTELREKLSGLNIDMKELEEEIHAAIHEEMDGEKERIKEEIRRLKEERRELTREVRRMNRHNHDDEDDNDWNASAIVALGLYGLGAVLLIQRSKPKNMV